ncbi:MAG: hypothetical protein N2483_03975 [Burkholderiaceae bacterium]|nr:hypothetical protein [Burkholderiaceae bacterium]
MLADSEIFRAHQLADAMLGALKNSLHRDRMQDAAPPGIVAIMVSLAARMAHMAFRCPNERARFIRLLGENFIGAAELAEREPHLLSDGGDWTH